MIRSVDEIIPFSVRHKNETVRQIIRSDSGYLKDLFLKDGRLVFSRECFKEICRLTAGHKDNWETPNNPTSSIFHRCKTYRVNYLFDFNQEELLQLNEDRLKSII